MFTGLVEEIGTIESTAARGSVLDIAIRAAAVLDGTAVGDSISIQGACQTVTAVGGGTFTIQSVEETIGRTTLGNLRRGSPVNLERSIRLGARLGGHIVTGHVDGVGRIAGVSGTRENAVLSIAQPRELARYIAEKGSVTIDGVSLTVTRAADSEFGVSVIPHTLSATTLGLLRLRDRVNIEVDIIARYVERLLGRSDPLTLKRLEELGF